ncbi:MAG: OmpA family protein [bacterium]|nr:OmpA family protein [bacterium]
MISGLNIRHLLFLALIGLLATACVHEPRAFLDLQHAQEAIVAAKASEAASQSADAIAALESRFLEARGILYACQEDKASELARVLINEANILATQHPAPQITISSKPQNRPPRAVLVAPAEGEVNMLLSFDASQSSDPDGDKLSFLWDYGDASSNRFSFPNATHRYRKPGRYTVQLQVDDGKGGSDRTSAPLTVIKRVVIHQLPGMVLFDFDRSRLKSEARIALDDVVRLMQGDASLQAEITGHTDWTGTERYNVSLSERRARAVERYLEQHGITSNRIRLDWKGETEPMVSNATKEGRAKNRRTIIVLRPR